jgi:hypothetical protein
VVNRHSAYSCVDLIENLLAGGESLIEVQAEAEHALDFAEKSQFGLIVDIITSQLGLVTNAARADAELRLF